MQMVKVDLPAIAKAAASQGERQTERTHGPPAPQARRHCVRRALVLSHTRTLPQQSPAPEPDPDTQIQALRRSRWRRWHCPRSSRGTRRR